MTRTIASLLLIATACLAQDPTVPQATMPMPDQSAQTPAPAPAVPAVTAASLQIGATYSFVLQPGVLTTGDSISGVLSEKTDSTIIIEPVGSSPVTFNLNLVLSSTMTAPPPHDSLNVKGCKVFTYDEAWHRLGVLGQVSVTLTSGSSFVGMISSGDSTDLTISVGGSPVTVTREIVAEIASAKPVQKKKVAELVKPKPPETPDTLWIIQPPDSNGTAVPPIVVPCHVVSSNSTNYTVKLADGQSKQYKLTDVSRVTIKEEASADEQLQRYAKSLNCPAGTVLSDLPPGVPDKPFFRVCVDKYEYPNQRDVMPVTNVSFEQADSLCQTVGKRLCTADEWQWSCTQDGSMYPYGNKLDEDACNRTMNPEPSGTHLKCAGKLGVCDMTGNVWEWVADAGRKPVLMGGPLTKCQTKTNSPDGSARPAFGFRCCKSN